MGPFNLGGPGLRTGMLAHWNGCESWHTKWKRTIINFVTYTCVYPAIGCKNGRQLDTEREYISDFYRLNQQLFNKTL